MKNKPRKSQETMDSLIKNGTTVIVASPKTIQDMKDSGSPIEEKFITYEEYLSELLTERQKGALDRLKKLPLIDQSVADGVVTEIYGEIRSSYALGFFTSTIVNSVLLLEYAMRLALYIHRIKAYPKYQWEVLERMAMKKLISQMKKANLITEEQEKALKEFNDTLRDPYLHINVHSLSDGIFISSLPGFNTKTGKKFEMKNVRVSEHKYLWFMGKRYFDKQMVLPILNFCVGYANNLLAEKKTIK
ncbi:MAG: hypothetical protein BWY29_00093 [Microgenomates group bacterium ADurb.Bin238]|nr:MAG: hypothetical protein BWY29_00093 [Microgenomates group bacterium ADurb.Bin238]